MFQPSKTVRGTGRRLALFLLLSAQVAISPGELQAGRRPLPSRPMTVPPLAQIERAAQATRPYPGAPIVESVEPDFGPRHGWTQIEVTGRNFERGLDFYVGGREAIDVERISSTRIRARTAENTFIGSADVIVRNPDGKAGGLLNGFLYEGSIFEVPGYNVPPDWNWVTCIRLADMNNDGKRDFLMASPWKPLDEQGPGNLIIYLQGPDRDGDGVPNFEPIRRNQILNDTKQHYTSLEVADLDRDGDLDFVATGRVEWYQYLQRNHRNRVYLNDGACNFRAKDLPGNQASKGVDIGDVNGDGNPDLAIANLDGQSQLFFGDGTGEFREVTNTHLPKAVLWTTHIHLVDVDGDRDLDAVLANASKRPGKKRGEPNRLYLNDGRGRFTNETEAMKFPSGDQRTFRVASADIDRDGDQDLVFANQGRCRLLINDGRGFFIARPLPPYRAENRWHGGLRDFSQHRNYDVLFADINVDGYPDLAFCSNAASLLLYLNVPDTRGQRTFEARPDLVRPMPAGHGAESIALADVDGDGKPDLTIGSGHEQTPLWINAWPEPFRFATCNTRYNLPYSDWVSRSCDTGDLDGDGRTDIAMGQHSEKEVMLFLQTEDRWRRKDYIATPVLTPGKSVVEDVALADVDGDRDLDMVLGLREQPAALFLNDGRADFAEAKGPAALPSTPMGTTKVLPVDVDLDGDVDLVMCNWDRKLFPGGGQQASLFINEGGGRFKDGTEGYLPEDKCTARGGDIGDINQDGYPDIVFACMKSTLLGAPLPNRLYLNRGRQAPGRFLNASDLLPENETKSTDAALCDVDRDGRLDIVFSNEIDLKGGRGEDNLYHQLPDGRFEDWSDHLPVINRINWEVWDLDVNRNGAPDILSNRSYRNYSAALGAKEEYGRLILQMNDGNGNFSIPGVRQLDYIDKEFDSWTGSCVDDLNGDGYEEIVQCVDGQVRIHQTFLRTKAVTRPVYAEVRVGDTVRFDASSTHFPWGLKATSFAWHFGDGDEASGEKVSHTYRKSGTYTVTLRVTDTAGHRDTDRVTVVVKAR